MSASPAKLRAFRLTVAGWPEVTSIYLTPTPGRARYLSYRAARDVGYRITFADLRIHRAPQFDALADTGRVVHGITEDHARHLLSLQTPAASRKQLQARVDAALAILRGYGPAEVRAGMAREALEATV